MAQNPWTVESIQAFYFLKCPECDFDTKEENSFETHATENHPLSLALFGKKSVIEDFNTIDIKEEPLSHFDTQNSYDYKESSTQNLFSQLSPICAQPKKKKEKIEQKNENTTIENNNVQIDKKCGTQFRPISCPICNKKFSDRPGLNRHSRIVHDKIKIAKCDICSQEFNTECSKKRHIESVHEGKIYGCDKCEKEFSYSASLLKHKKNYHNSKEDLNT